ncbi:IncA family protein [Chlamydia abortus]|uniref:IncA family protein n=1 Tax=Chlamydia abortus TaxID=83555 RepID=UPI00091C8605|nr:IncA family protein [Chlamydia abortus]SGA01516.1 putative inner membrane protein [Chlamydia abortus]SGA24293.1 putative inner membrane protein [Chlamydia abortus]SGA27961.1 putative inner membrane protein [Chlamydia abortus]SHD82772.1 putative inner membrane protein [Chlamydia abortus]SHN95069.1 putative inner membrane protein [Chlamydia abortus]
MIPSILRSSSHEEALQRVSVLNRICQNSHVSRKTVSLTLIAVGIILVISGILLLTLTITSLPAGFSIALGATVLALGTSLASFGVALRILKKPQANNEGEVVLATELINMKQVVEQKTEEVNRLQGEVSASQAQLAEISQELTTTKELGSDLQTRLDEFSQLLTQSRESLVAVEARLQATEESLSQKEEQLERSRGALEGEQAKAGQLEARVRELASQLQETSENLDRAIASQQDLMERLTTDHDSEITRLTRILATKTEELDAAQETIRQIQRQLSAPTPSTLLPSSPRPLRKSSSTFSLNGHSGSPTERSNRIAALFSKFKKSSSGAVTPTSRSASSSDQPDPGDQDSDENDTEIAEEANEEES